jgi:hypothetical protein
MLTVPGPLEHRDVSIFLIPECLERKLDDGSSLGHVGSTGDETRLFREMEIMNLGIRIAHKYSTIAPVPPLTVKIPATLRIMSKGVNLEGHENFAER